MERNIGDQLNKAFEAYRQASIEKDNAKRELQQTTDHYERFTQQLQKQIEEQQLTISKLEAQLVSAKQPPEEVKGHPAPRNQDDKTTSPFDHLHANPSSCRKMQHMKDNMGTAVDAPHISPVDISAENKHALEAFEALQGKFQQIRMLTRRQKDHLKRFYRGNDMTNEQQFSMPIQCTDGTTEQAERSFPSALRPGSTEQAERPFPPAPQPPASLASRGAHPEDRDLEESLAKLSVKFPPSADSEDDFLNSTPERHLEELTGLRQRPGRRLEQPVGMMWRPATLGRVPNVVDEEEMSAELSIPFPYPTSSSLPVSPSASLYPTSSSLPASPSAALAQENVRGPQQPLWSPDLCEEAARPASAEPGASPPSNRPHSCAFCKAMVPQDAMNSHLYFHCEVAPPN